MIFKNSPRSAKDNDAPVTVEAIEDSADQILVFRLSGELSDEDEDRWIDHITRMQDNAGFQSKVLVLPEAIDISRVTK